MTIKFFLAKLNTLMTMNLQKAGMPLGLDHLAYDDPERYHQVKIQVRSTVQ
jgi:hypothetical protein